MLVELHRGEVERGVELGARLGLARPRQRVEDPATVYWTAPVGQTLFQVLGATKSWPYRKLTM